MDGQNYYAPPQAQLQPEQSGLEYRYGATVLASRASRLGAVCLNSLISMVAAVPFIIAMFVEDRGATHSGEPTLSLVMILLGASLFLVILVANIYLLSTNGQSIGKKIVGIKIVRGDLRTPASFARICLLRWLPINFVRVVPFVGELAYLGNFLFIFGAEQRCGHDYIADTHVVRADVAYNELAEKENYSDVAW